MEYPLTMSLLQSNHSVWDEDHYFKACLRGGYIDGGATDNFSQRFYKMARTKQSARKTTGGTITIALGVIPSLIHSNRQTAFQETSTYSSPGHTIISEVR